MRQQLWTCFFLWGSSSMSVFSGAFWTAWGYRPLSDLLSTRFLHLVEFGPHHIWIRTTFSWFQFYTCLFSRECPSWRFICTSSFDPLLHCRCLASYGSLIYRFASSSFWVLFWCCRIYLSGTLCRIPSSPLGIQRLRLHFTPTAFWTFYTPCKLLHQLWFISTS